MSSPCQLMRRELVDDSSDDNRDDSGSSNHHPLQHGNVAIVPCHAACLLLAVWGLRKPEVQGHLAAERSASRLIWEQIWEQNVVKPAGNGAMRRNRPDA